MSDASAGRVCVGGGVRDLPWPRARLPTPPSACPASPPPFPLPAPQAGTTRPCAACRSRAAARSGTPSTMSRWRAPPPPRCSAGLARVLVLVLPWGGGALASSSCLQYLPLMPPCLYTTLLYRTAGGIPVRLHPLLCAHPPRLRSRGSRGCRQLAAAPAANEPLVSPLRSRPPYPALPPCVSTCILSPAPCHTYIPLWPFCPTLPPCRPAFCRRTAAGQAPGRATTNPFTLPLCTSASWRPLGCKPPTG